MAQARRAFGVGALLASVALVGACGGSVRTATPPPTTAPGGLAPQTNPDGSFTLAVGAAPASFNVLSASGSSPSLRAVLEAVWPSVYETGPDGALHLDSAFVQSARVTSTAPETVTYRINPEAVWSDGVAITYRDFAYDWQAQSGSAAYSDSAGPFTPASTQGYSQIRSVSEVGGDPDVVAVTFSSPDPDWQALFSTMVPAHVAQRIGFSNGFTSPVADDVSGGPYVVQTYDRGTSVTEVRNPRWWGSPAGLSSVTFRFVADSSQVPGALGSGIVDGAVVDPTAAVVGAIKALAPTVAYDQVAGDTWEDLQFDEADRWLRDPAIRQAVSLAVDRPAIIARVAAAYEPDVVPLDNHLFVPAEAGYTDDSGNLYGSAQDAKALQVLQAAGYTTTGGTLTSDGVAVTLDIAAPGGDTAAQAAEQAIVAELAAIGIRVSEVDTGDVVAGQRAGTVDLAVVPVTDSPFLSEEDPTYVTGGSGNAVGFSDPAVDRLVAQAATTFAGPARQALYDQIDAQLWRDNVDLPLWQLPTGVATTGPIEGLAPNPTAAGPTWDMATWTDRA